MDLLGALLRYLGTLLGPFGDRNRRWKSTDAEPHPALGPQEGSGRLAATICGRFGTTFGGFMAQKTSQEGTKSIKRCAENRLKTLSGLLDFQLG